MKARTVDLTRVNYKQRSDTTSNESIHTQTATHQVPYHVGIPNSMCVHDHQPYNTILSYQLAKR